VQQAPARYDRPYPKLTVTNAPFWAGLRQRQVILPRCGECGSWIWPIAAMCQSCWSEDVRWEEVSGKGTINSWVRYHRAFAPQYQDDLPYNVIEVTLREGIRLISNLVTDDEAALRSGTAVSPFFDEVAGDLTLLRFVPDRGSDV
jgi:uncharacterized OB-fold protein